MKLVLLIAATVLAGCATTEPVWVKYGSSEQDFYMDRGECQARAFSTSFPTAMQVALVFSGCMQGKGWQREQRPIRR